MIVNSAYNLILDKVIKNIIIILIIKLFLRSISMNEIEQIRDILMQHWGKSNAITSREIANLIGIIEDDTHHTTREMILQAARRYNLPLAADTVGYYLINNDFEYRKYMINLDSRIAGIKERKRLITENYNLWKEQNRNL